MPEIHPVVLAHTFLKNANSPFTIHAIVCSPWLVIDTQDVVII